MFDLLELSEKENLLGFDNVTLSQLIASGKLVHIDNCDKMAQSGKWANDIKGCNRYYRISEAYNMVFMVVENNYGCIIPEYVEHKGNRINIVKMLSKCHWTKGSIYVDKETLQALKLIIDIYGGFIRRIVQ